MIRNYHFGKMIQQRLNGLSILYIKKDMIDHIDINTIISDFASKNVCGNYFV
jgi:hypothetical protein